MGYRTWTDKDLELAVKSSKTKSEVIRKLGLRSNSSGNFQIVDVHIKRLKLDITHFHEIMFGKPNKPKHIKELLVKNSTYTNTVKLKSRLIRANLLKEECYECKTVMWMGRKLSLQLDHIDGDRSNNELNNLRLLCPNCHSLTSTYSRTKMQNKLPENKCKCGVVICRRSSMCTTCDAISRRGKNLKINWPNMKALLNMVKEIGYVQTGIKLGVSDRAVKKHILRNNKNCAPNGSRKLASPMGFEPMLPA